MNEENIPTKGETKLKTQLLELVERLDDAYNSKGYTFTSVPTLEYLPNGSLTVLAGHPYSGKTKLLVNLVKELAVEKAGKVTLLHFCQKPVDILTRLLSDGDVEYELRLSHGAMNDPDWKWMIDGIDKLANSNLQVIDSTKLHSWEEAVEQIKETAPAIVLLDDWSSVGSDSNNHLMFQKVATEQLKELALDLGIPVVVTATSARETIKRDDKSPIMADLDHYTGIFHDADQITGLYRPSIYEDDFEGKDKIQLRTIWGGHAHCKRAGKLTL